MTFTHEPAFRHYPMSDSRKHFRVLVFRTSGEMNRYVQWVCPPRAKWRPKSRVGGCFLTWKKPSPCIGTVVLCREHLTPDTIAHECAHAVLHFTRKLFGDANITADLEEWCAGTLGRLVGDVHRRTGVANPR